MIWHENRERLILFLMIAAAIIAGIASLITDH